MNVNKTKIIQNHLMEQGATWLNKHGGADGIWGKATQKAYAEYNKQFYNYPKYEELNGFYGKPDFERKTHPHITYISPPYPMYLAWQPSTKLSRIAVHEKCADSLRYALEDIYQFYGWHRIERYGLDQFGGTLNVRNMRGSVHKVSVHAYGAAIDLDPVRNQLSWNKKQSYIPQHCPDVIEIFKAYGWDSLGEKHDMDWQHFQACEL